MSMMEWTSRLFSFVDGRVIVVALVVAGFEMLKDGNGDVGDDRGS